MASPLHALLLQRCAFVCDSCLSGIRPLRRSRLVTTRPLSTASSPKCTTTTRPVSNQYRDNRASTRPAHTASLRTSLVARPYSNATTTTQPASSGIAQLPHRRLVSLSGPDAAKFLQGLITNNVDPSRQAPFYSAFLDARGRVLWDVFIWVWPELVAKKGHWACYIEVDEGEAEVLKLHLKRHKLRSKVQIGQVGEGDAQMMVWAAWGSAAEQVSGAVVAGLTDSRAPAMHRYIAKADCETIAEGLEPIDTKEYHLQRYRCGVPEGPTEISRESALPMEYNFDLSSGIDFKKGCYVGQELTIRTKHTGMVRKRALPVRLYHSPASEIVPEHGANILPLDENGSIKEGRAAGRFLAGIGNVGLALCRLESMTSMKVSPKGGLWKPGMEFGVQTSGGVVKVKPVLYDWFVERERELWEKSRTRLW